MYIHLNENMLKMKEIFKHSHSFGLLVQICNHRGSKFITIIKQASCIRAMSISSQAFGRGRAILKTLFTLQCWL
jgi:hypothetical protein